MQKDWNPGNATKAEKVRALGFWLAACAISAAFGAAFVVFEAGSERKTSSWEVWTQWALSGSDGEACAEARA